MKNVSIFVLIGVRPDGWTANYLYVVMTSTLRFSEHCKYSNCQTLHDGNIDLALPIRTTCISRSQQCQTVLTENFMFLFD